LRLFDSNVENVRVTLFRDKHAWCPYCQKVWIWLEEKKVPYRIEKVTMFCYGDKEPWYTKKVPSGMLPALQLDGQIITESDEILYQLEDTFGPLVVAMDHQSVIPVRKLERSVFRAWCQWLCYPASSTQQEKRSQKEFEWMISEVEKALGATPGPFFLETFSVADVVCIPYFERMAASLYYYKGYVLRDPALHPRLSEWFDALEEREVYRGTQSDFHTHCHDLPPQMGGCFENNTPQQQHNKRAVDHGPFEALPDANFSAPESARDEALFRVVKHKDYIVEVNPNPDKSAVDEALRCALTLMMDGTLVNPPPHADATLRYIRDRVNVPRDMPLHSARLLRQALEDTAAASGQDQGAPLTLRHRRDQDPKLFGRM